MLRPASRPRRRSQGIKRVPARLVGSSVQRRERLSAEDCLTEIIEGKLLRALCLGPSRSAKADRLTRWLFGERREP